jgi:putative ABC transport system substrate-binding protein
MHGKHFLISLALIGLTIGLPFVPAQQASASGPIAVLLSDDEAAYSAPVKTFMEEVGSPANRYNLAGNIEQAPAVMQKLLETHPSLIFALGAKAAYIAKLWTSNHPRIPVVFAMVLNYRHYDFLASQDNMTGIAYETAPGTQFINAMLFFPHVRKIGVVYSELHSSETVMQAKSEAASLGVELIAESIANPRNFKPALKKMLPRIDAFWVLTDPVVFTLENIGWMRTECIKNRTVTVGQSENIIRDAALLSIAPDLYTIGSQAAAIAHNILSDSSRPAEIGVVDPLGTRILLNTAIARRMGISINPSALNFASEVTD